MQAHALDTSANTNVNHTRLDLVGNVDAGLQAGGALAVEAADGRRLREARDKAGSAELCGATARGKDVADADILDEGRVDA